MKKTLPINVQIENIPMDYLLQLLLYGVLLIACCVVPGFMEGRSSPTYGSWETDSWFVTYDIQKAYDTIVKEVEDWRETAVLKRPTEKKSRFSFLEKKKNPIIFAVDNEVSPRLYRLKDDVVGEISFELSEAIGGGASIKATYHGISRPMIQDFKAKMPIKTPLMKI